MATAADRIREEAGGFLDIAAGDQMPAMLQHG